MNDDRDLRAFVGSPFHVRLVDAETGTEFREWTSDEIGGRSARQLFCRERPGDNSRFGIENDRTDALGDVAGTALRPAAAGPVPSRAPPSSLAARHYPLAIFAVAHSNSTRGNLSDPGTGKGQTRANASISEYAGKPRSAAPVAHAAGGVVRPPPV